MTNEFAGNEIARLEAEVASLQAQLSTAKSEGRKEMREEAAKTCDLLRHSTMNNRAQYALERAARSIRALTTGEPGQSAPNSKGEG